MAGKPSYIRRALAEPEPPPVSQSMLALTRARLFDGVFNTVLTIIGAIIIVALLWPTVRFLVLDAVWKGSSRVDCLPETLGREVGGRHPASIIGQSMRNRTIGHRTPPSIQPWSGTSITRPLRS